MFSLFLITTFLTFSHPPESRFLGSYQTEADCIIVKKAAEQAIERVKAQGHIPKEVVITAICRGTEI